jgi:hypothetical protein
LSGKSKAVGTNQCNVFCVTFLLGNLALANGALRGQVGILPRDLYGRSQISDAIRSRNLWGGD